jgi:O-antigen ligase
MSDMIVTGNSNKYSALLGLQLGIMSVGTIIGRSQLNESSKVFEIIQLLFLLWPLCFFGSIIYDSGEFLKKRIVATSIIVFLCACVYSSVKSPIPVRSLTFSILTFLFMYMAVIFCHKIPKITENQIFKIYSYFGVIFCFLVLFLGTKVGGGRLGGVLNPNSIGMICVSLFFSCLFFENKFIKWTLAAVFFGVLILTGSRASLLGLIIGLFIFGFFSIRIKKNYINAAVIIFVCTFLIYYSVIYCENIIKTIESLFAVDDEYRGISSGATGRLFAWKEAWLLFEKNSFLGVGYRAHEYYMKIYSSAHNGYLALLAEVGILGFLSAITLVIYGIFGLLSNVVEKNNVIKLSIVFSYLTVFFFERYFFNLGNSASLLFIYCFISGALSVSDNNYKNYSREKNILT